MNRPTYRLRDASTDLLAILLVDVLVFTLFGAILEFVFVLPFVGLVTYLEAVLICSIVDGIFYTIWDVHMGAYVAILPIGGILFGILEAVISPGYLTEKWAVVFGIISGIITLMIAIPGGAQSGSSTQGSRQSRQESGRQADHGKRQAESEPQNDRRQGRSVEDPTRQFADRIDPMAVRTTAADIVSSEPTDGTGSWHTRQLAELHTYVNENITYTSDPRARNYVSPPEETLKTGAGDCDCQAVLVASLFEAVGATTRLALCQSYDNEYHMLAEVKLADSWSETSAVNTHLDRYYTSIGQSVDGFYYESDSNGIWYPADTAMGGYIGDIFQLSRGGFIDGPDADGSWSWYTVEYRYP